MNEHGDLTVADLIEQLQKLPQDAIVVHEDYDTSDIFGVCGFEDNPIIMLKYIEDVRQKDPLVDYSHYEPGGDILAVVLNT